MTRVHLFGSLGALFGATHNLELTRVGEVSRALGCQLPGFLQHLLRGSWAVISDGRSLTADELGLPAGETLHIVPEPEFHSWQAAAMIGVGVALVAASFIPGLNVAVWGAAVTYASIAFSVGLALTMAGISMLLTVTPKASELQKTSSSSLFGNIDATAAQGGVVPVVYGRIRTGSVIVSTGLSTVAG